MEIYCEKFGTTAKGEEIIKYNIIGSKIKVEVLNYGCTVKSLYTPNKYGVLENIVLGFETLEEYEVENTPYFGCVIGRVAGRTKNARLKIRDKDYQLTKNNGANNLHGGFEGLHRRVWQSSYILEEQSITLIFKLKSMHLEEGFPGEVDFIIKYIVEENALSIIYEGFPDRETFLNLTNHMYFNLSGNCKENILKEEVKINALGYYEVNEEILPQKLVEKDEIFSPDNVVILEKSLKTNSKQIEIVGGGYDHPFLLSKQEKIDGYAVDKKSGRKLEFITDQPIVIFYTGNFLEESSNYKKHSGFCLEAQDYPDIANLSPKNMKIYSSQNLYTQKTSYIFSID